jgi:hypothetical protein
MEQMEIIQSSVGKRLSGLSSLVAAILAGVVASLMSGLVGFIGGGLFGELLTGNYEIAARAGGLGGFILGVSHAVYFVARLGPANTGTYWATIAGGLGAGIIFGGMSYRFGGYLPSAGNWLILFFLPVAGAVVGYYLSDRLSR